MATATKAKPAAETAAPTTGAGMERAKQIIAEKGELFEAAETLLTLRANGSPSEDDQTVFAALGWSPLEIELQVERAGEVTRWKGRAASKSVRAATAAACAAAVAKEAREGRELLEEIERLHARRAELARAARAAEAAEFGQGQAVNVLRDVKMLPAHIQLKLRLEGRSVGDHPDHRRLAAARGRLKNIEGILQLQPGKFADMEKIRLHCGSNPECGDELWRWGNAPFRSSPGPEGPSTVGPPFPIQVWESYVRKLDAERGQLSELIRELEPADVARQATFDALHNYHVDRIG